MRRRLAAGVALGVALLAGRGVAPGVGAEAAPAAVCFVIDTSGSLRAADLERARHLASALASRLDPAERVGVISFDDRPEVRLALDAERAGLDAALAGLRPRGSFTALHDALYDAARALGATGAARRAVVLLTDGRDEQGALLFEDAERELEANAVHVFAIGTGPRVDERFLRRLAKLTGGAYYPAGRLDDPPALAAELAGAVAALAPTPVAAAPIVPAPIVPAPIVPAPSAGSVPATPAAIAATPSPSVTPAAAAAASPSPSTRPSPAPSSAPNTGAPRADAARSGRGDAGRSAWGALAARVSFGAVIAALLILLVLRRSRPAGGPADAGSAPRGPATGADPGGEPARAAAGAEAEAEAEVAAALPREPAAVEPADVEPASGTLPLGATLAALDGRQPKAGAPAALALPALAPDDALEEEDTPLDALDRTVVGGIAAADLDTSDVHGESLSRTFLLELKPVLVVRKGRNAGETFLVPPEGEITIGRASLNAIVVQDSSVSSRHVRIRVEGKVFTLMDLNSTNGTYVNDRRVERGQELFLQEGDVIRMGETELVFKVEQRRR